MMLDQQKGEYVETELRSVWGYTGWRWRFPDGYYASASFDGRDFWTYAQTSPETADKAFHRAARRAFFRKCLLWLAPLKTR
ncbi:MAG: hypothetical protein HGA47_08225 [Zoogloea sp.]|nr:hypothetical protein [Zoogloea sp.]